MSMYSMLLAAALDREAETVSPKSTAEALARVLRCRPHADASRTPQRGSNYDRTIDSLSYDVALVQLARLVGVDCDVSQFDQAGLARSLLIQEFLALGLPLFDAVDSSREGGRSEVESQG
jgi:hypothetical protein